MRDSSDLKNLGRPIRVGVVLVNSKTEILDVAPIDIFSGISKEFIDSFPPQMISDEWRKQALDVEFHWVNESGETANLTAGGVINPSHTFATCPPLDIALMGAHGVDYTLSKAETDFIKKTHDDCAAFLFICGGVLAALQSDLLEGKTATAPRPLVELMRQMNPGVNWVSKRWARDGKVWTSGALLNGTDMTREFVTEAFGGEGTYAEFCLRLGGYPYRDIDYADVPWPI